jgi:tRNA (guanine-N7-)-methyltransferase
MKTESQNCQNNRLIRSFGRIKSRKLSDHKNFLLENFLPKYEFQIPKQVQDDVCAPKPQCHPELASGSNAILEIGFGFGDFLFEKAKKNPEIFFLGSEPHLNGIVNLLAKLEKEPLQNLKISREDVRILFKNFQPKIFDEIFILFPDPWPKSKHFKRRLITAEFLDEVLSPKVKNGAKLIIATDHDSYKTWILSEILRSKKFSWTANSKKDWQNFPADWIETKYQKKAAAEGRTSVIFNLKHAD